MKYDFLEGLSGKWWVWLIAVIIGAWAALFVADYYQSWKIAQPRQARYLEAVAEYAKYEAEQTALEARYAADFDGGETPQETWDLFVAALKTGDTDQAAKYYIVEQQERMKEAWAGVKERNTLNIHLNDYEKIIGGDMYPDGERFEFYTDDIDGGPGFVYMLVKNPLTGVWKIEDL
ncbi:hypothetical protein CL644_02400 [bacterium]|nr:hypothetical protein [bacterium]